MVNPVILIKVCRQDNLVILIKVFPNLPVLLIKVFPNLPAR